MNNAKNESNTTNENSPPKSNISEQYLLNGRSSIGNLKDSLINQSEARSREVLNGHVESLSSGNSPAGSKESLIDTIPFGIEGIQTVVDSQFKKENDQNTFQEDIIAFSDQTELERIKGENYQLKKSLKEAASVNQQWRNYHDQRLNYIQKLHHSITELQMEATNSKAEGKINEELHGLKEALFHQQRENQEHVQLLQLQVRAHRDDWEAERYEKKVAETGRIQAEARVGALHVQLRNLLAKVGNMEANQGFCRCCATVNSSHSPTIDDNHHTNNTYNKENRDTISPLNYSNNSSGNTSRSSSFSVPDRSNPTSPTIACKNSASNSNPVSKAASPTSISSIKNTKSNSNGELHTKNIEGTLSNQALQHKVYEVSTHSIDSGLHTDSETSKKLNDANSGIIESSSGDAKGTGAKNLPKINCKASWNNDEIDAKHRARSILTSALPTSPSSTKPSSSAAITATHTSAKGHFSLSSTMITPVKVRPPFVAHRRPKCVYKREILGDTDKQKPSDSDKKQNPNSSSNSPKSNQELSEKLKSNDASLAHQSNKREFIRVTNKPNTEDTMMPPLRNGSGLEASPENRSSEGSPKIQDNIEFNEDSTSTFSCIDETECIQRSDEKDTSEYDPTEPNDNCTIAKSNSSRSHSKAQVISAASSPSSSPGISLMTFSLNADGQGVPGAILFALGSDSKQKCQNVNHDIYHSEPKYASYEGNMKEISPVSNEDGNVANCGGRLVNSAWVKLMDKECVTSKSSSAIPWRTARAIPSHQLSSSRKISNDEKSKSDTQSLNGQASHRRPQTEGPCQIRKQVHESKVQKSTHKHPCTDRETNSMNSSAPHLCQNTHGNAPIIINKDPEIDLKGMASRNITSAILSYECSSRETNIPQSRSSQNRPRHKNTKKECSRGENKTSFICPTCQMIFHNEQLPYFRNHVKLCGGPTYIDM